MIAPVHRMRLVAAVLGALTAVLALAAVVAPPAADASRGQEAIFQDDGILTNAPAPEVRRTLDTMRDLGADRVRVLLFWKRVAPDPDSRTRPSFAPRGPTDPASYPGWHQYDLIVREADRRGIEIQLDAAPPVPAWATGFTSNETYADHYDPSASDFENFVRAAGTRYSGTYVPTSEPGDSALPRVSFWSLWNEPNEYHFLAPIWGRSPVEAAAPIYRRLVDAGYRALQDTAHGGDTILIGETAPKGKPNPGTFNSMKPLRFLRALYCVDRRLRPLTGSTAQALGCPTSDQARRFPAEHPGLFRVSGWGHHPYSLSTAPNVPSGDPDDVTLADLPRLTGALSTIFARYQAGGGLPVFLTEFGFQTRPPDPLGVSPPRQAEYMNQSEYMTFRNPRVRSYSQFLLVDDPPNSTYDPSSLAYWGTFQTGIVGLNGRPKPSFFAFQMPIHLPQTRRRRVGSFRVWGGVRPARNGSAPLAVIQFKPARSRSFTTVKRVRGNFRGYVDTTVRLGYSGWVRIMWNDPAKRRTLFSRSVAVRVG